jgi:nicotinamide mononucleotide transporter
MAWTELIGAVLSGFATWLTVRNSVYCWPTNIIAAAFYLVVFTHERLYAGAVLQVFYIGLSIYGWWEWKYGDPATSSALPISHARLSDLFVPTLFCIVATTAVSVLLMQWTNADYPVLDTILTGMSLLATWMTARKYVENWYVWIVADLLYIWMFVGKQLWYTAALNVIFCIFAILGYRFWIQHLGVRPQSVSHPTADYN